LATRSYRSPQRAEAAARTRETILEAATAVLASPAAAGAFSLDAVAKAAGVTRLTVYNQFGSRRALMEAVFDEIARRGGLARLAAAMATPDPRAALDALIDTFCDFWSYRRDAMGRLEAESAADAEFAEMLAARNERRRAALSVLVGRLATPAPSSDSGMGDLVDVLFALTGYGFFAALTSDGRPVAAAAALIRSLARDAVTRALAPQPGPS
jgi:AcrR family transcriptional regulator